MLILSMMLAISAPVAVADDKPAENKKICRTYQVTGSLVRTRRVCYTAKEWTRIRADERDAAERYIMDNAGKPSLSN